jgi:hypothetical protein
MSFDVNIGRSQPIIKAASNMNNDGGSGGNTGYMMRGRKKDNEKSKKNLFDGNVEIDSFEMKSKLPQNDYPDYPDEESWVGNLIKKIIK